MQWNENKEREGERELHFICSLFVTSHRGGLWACVRCGYDECDPTRSNQLGRWTIDRLIASTISSLSPNLPRDVSA